VTNFELSRPISRIAEPAGTLGRQSVAVVVDHAWVEPAAGTGGTERVARPRDAEEMQKITEIVRAAIGIDESRGDVLTVENVAFDERSMPGAEVGGGAGWEPWLRAGRYAALPIAVLLLVLFAVRPGIAALRALSASGAEPGGDSPPTVAALQARLQAELASGSLGRLTEGASPLRRRLIEAAGEDPRAAALVVKSWLDQRAKRG
jgi:flagellar M-ring protein FliF